MHETQFRLVQKNEFLPRINCNIHNVMSLKKSGIQAPASEFIKRQLFDIFGGRLMLDQ